MSVVGRAYVNVRAVTRQVEPDIQRGVDGALDRVSARMESPDGAGVKLGNSIGDGVRKSGVAKRIEAAVTDDVDTDRAGSQLGDAIGRGIFDNLDFSARLKAGLKSSLDKALDAAIPDIEEAGKKKGKSFGDGFGKGLAGLAVNPTALIGLAVPPAVTQGLTAVSTLGAGAIGILNTLGPAAATAGVTGAAGITALLTAVGALTLAFKTQSGSLSALKEDLQPIKDDFRDTGLAIQRDLFPALAETAGRVNAALGPEIREGLLETSDAVVGITDRFTKLAESPFFQRNIDTILESNAVSLGLFGKAGVNVAGILSDIGAQASPAVERVAHAVKDLSDDLFSDTRVGATNGGLAGFFDRAVDTTFQWSRIIGDVSTGLGRIFGQASELGGSLLGKLEGVTQRFEDWSGSATGKDSIGEFFEQSGPVISAFGGVIGSLGSTLADLSGDTSGLVATLDAVSGGLPGLGSVLGETSKHFADLLSVILPLVGELGERLAPYIGDAAGALSDDLGPALDKIVDPIGDLATNVLDLADNFTPVITVIGDGLVPVLTIASGAVKAVGDVLDALPGPIATTIISLGLLRFAFGRVIANEQVAARLAIYKAQMAELRAANAAASTSFAGLRAAGSTAVGALGGPLGIALGVAAVAYGIFASKNAESKAQVDALTESIDKQTGALSEQSNGIIAKSIADSGLAEDAEALGISLDLVTAAVTGNVDAYSQLEDQLHGYTAESAAVAAASGNSEDAIDAFDSKLADLIGTTDTAVGRALLQGKVMDSLSGSTDGASDAFAGAGGSLGRFIKQNQEIIGTGQTVNTTLKTMERRILSVNDAAVKTIEGQIGFRQSIADAKKDFKESAEGLGVYTQAGRDNITSLLGIAKAAESVEGSTKKQQKAMKEARDTILDLAKSKTGDDDKALKLTNRIFDLSTAYDGIPKDVTTGIEAPTLKEQIKQAKTLKKVLEDMDGRSYHFSLTNGEGPNVPQPNPGVGNATTASYQAPFKAPQNPNAGLTPRRAPGDGVNFNGPVTIQPKDYKDFTDGVQRSNRRKALGGVGE